MSKNARREDIDGISGGRFVQPQTNRILPPVRSYHLQGGRFVHPTADDILPPIRQARLESDVGIDWENAYHFGRKY